MCLLTVFGVAPLRSLEASTYYVSPSCRLPRGEVIGLIMIIDPVGVDLTLHHIVVVDQIGVSPIGRMMEIMIKMMTVGDSIKGRGQATRHRLCRPLMILDSI